MSDEPKPDRVKVQFWCSPDELAEIDDGARLDSRNRTSFLIAAALERARGLRKERGGG